MTFSLVSLLVPEEVTFSLLAPEEVAVSLLTPEEVTVSVVSLLVPEQTREVEIRALSTKPSYLGYPDPPDGLAACPRRPGRPRGINAGGVPEAGVVLFARPRRGDGLFARPRRGDGLVGLVARIDPGSRCSRSPGDQAVVGGGGYSSSPSSPVGFDLNLSISSDKLFEQPLRLVVSCRIGQSVKKFDWLMTGQPVTNSQP